MADNFPAVARALTKALVESGAFRALTRLKLGLRASLRFGSAAAEFRAERQLPCSLR